MYRSGDSNGRKIESCSAFLHPLAALLRLNRKNKALTFRLTEMCHPVHK
jgi:hypothetical protein